VQKTANITEAEIAIVDVGSSLGALNRAALLACDAVVVPVAPDLFSLQGLKNIGPSLIEWRTDWQTLLDQTDDDVPSLLSHAFKPIGYIVQQHLARADRPVKAYAEWINQIPAAYHQYVLREAEPFVESIEQDPERIWMLKHYASLVPLAMQARKPMFDLKQADGASGSTLRAVDACRKMFSEMVTELSRRLDIVVPL